MKLKDLQKYKTLDITQLSGSPWNTAEKVLGLDSGDTVVMANRMDDEAKQYTDEAIASALTSYYTKDEVDEIVADIDVTEQLANYYTKSEVDTANAAQDERIENNENDIADLQSGMVSKSELETAMADETARTESTYAKSSDIPDLTPYATKGWVESKSYVNGAFVDAKVNEAITSETARTESVYAKKSDIPDMGEYATENYVDAAIQVETARTESTYLKEHQSLENYYTKAQVDSAITRVEEEIPLVPVNVSAFVNDAGYLTEHQSLAGLFNSASYDSETKRINFYDKSNVLSSYIDATAFIKDGMVERVYITGSTLVVSFNTDAGTEDIELDLTDVFDPANYYTKDQVDNLMAAETARTESTYLKEHQSLANYYNKGEVDGMFTSAATAIGNAIENVAMNAEQYTDNAVAGLATEQYVDDAIAGIPEPPTDYATQGDIDAAVQGLASEQYVDDAIAAIPSPDLSEYATHSEVDNAVGDVVMGIGMLGMVNDVSASGGTVTVRKTGMENGQIVTGSTSFNVALPSDIDTAIAAETARTESTYLKEHQSLDDYYTKAEVNSRLQDKADRQDVLDVKLEVDDFIANETARTEETYAKKSEIPSLTGYATQQWVQNQGYLTQHQDISGKLDKTDFNTYTGATETALAGKLDTTAFTQGMTSETARTESVYAKKTEIPSLNGYATEAWVEGKGYITGVTVDDELTSSSTNAVQSKAIYDVLNGVTSSTQMEISSVDSTIQLRYRFYGNPNSLYLTTYFKEANIDGYYVIDLGDLPVGEAQNINELRLSNIIINGTYYGFEGYTPETSNLGQKVLIYPDGGNIWVTKANLGDTYDYYLVLNTNENYVFLSATLPVITEVTDHKANISDLPTAQDGSDFKQYVYNGDNTKQVVSRISVSTGYDWGRSGNKKGEINNTISNSVYPWNSNAGTSSTSRLSIGSEYLPGIKSIRDSVIIDKADQALYGFTEQITLTPTSASTDYINEYGTQYYFSETNDPRYLVYSLASGNYLSISEIYLSGAKYAIKNAPYQTTSNIPPIGIYQLAEVGNQYYGNGIYLNTPYYIIIDKELLTLEIADSLAVTRAKNIQEAFNNIPAPDMSDYVSKDELTGSTEQQAIEIGADDTGATISVQKAPSYELETLNLKSTSVNKYKVLDISGWTGTAFPQYFTYSGSQMGFQDFVQMVPDTPYTLTQGEGNHSQITFSGTSPRYIVLNIEDNTVYVSDNLPSVAVEVPGVLDDYAKTTDIPVVPTNVSAFNNDAGYLTQHQSLANYYNKTEIDNMVGDIESLLANI